MVDLIFCESSKVNLFMVAIINLQSLRSFHKYFDGSDSFRTWHDVEWLTSCCCCGTAQYTFYGDVVVVSKESILKIRFTVRIFWWRGLTPFWMADIIYMKGVYYHISAGGNSLFRIMFMFLLQGKYFDGRVAWSETDDYYRQALSPHNVHYVSHTSYHVRRALALTSACQLACIICFKNNFK